MDIIRNKIAKLQEEIDAACKRAEVAEQHLREQEVISSRLEQELRGKEAIIASLERDVDREVAHRKEVEAKLSRMEHELRELTGD